MEELSGIIADQNANIHNVRHDRSVDGLEIGEAYLVFRVESSGAEHAASIMEAVEAAGYDVENLTQTIR
jgi:threonine dehydratase